MTTFVSLYAVLVAIVNSMIRWGKRSAIAIKSVGKLIVFTDELVDFSFDHGVLVVEHTNMVFQCL